MHRIFFVSLLLCLAACAGNEPLSEESWRLIGKISIETQTESRILGIDWSHSVGEDTISLRGPLGLKVALIRMSGGKLVLSTGDVNVTYDDDSYVLDNSGLGGLDIPWRHFANWVRHGEPEASRLANWQFQVTEVSADGPVVMKLEHPDIIIKLRVIRWEIP